VSARAVKEQAEIITAIIKAGGAAYQNLFKKEATII